MAGIGFSGFHSTRITNSEKLKHVQESLSSCAQISRNNRYARGARRIYCSERPHSTRLIKGSPSIIPLLLSKAIVMYRTFLFAENQSQQIFYNVWRNGRTHFFFSFSASCGMQISSFLWPYMIVWIL